MGLFDKAETRVERHTSGLNKKARFNEYGKKIFDIPEKGAQEIVEEAFGFNREKKKAKQKARDEKMFQEGMKYVPLINENEIDKLNKEKETIINGVKKILSKEIPGCEFENFDLNGYIQNKNGYEFHNFRATIFQLSDDNFKKFISKSKNEKLKTADESYDYPDEMLKDIETRIINPIKQLGLKQNNDYGQWAFLKYKNGKPFICVQITEQLSFDIVITSTFCIKKTDTDVKENYNMNGVEEGLIAKIIQGPETIKEELPEYEKKYREMQMNKVIKENTNKNFLKSLGNKTKLCVLENVLSSIYYDALYLDDDFKEYNRNVINESVHKFLDERGGYKCIEEAYAKNKSPLLKEIMRICEESSTEINKRKIEESKNAEEWGHNLFKFDMTADESKHLDYSKEQIGLKQISDVVKEKVLNVVKEEKKREAEHEDLLSEIENELSENPDLKDPEAVAEALNKIFVKNVNIEEGTLFNSLLRTGLKSVIESGYESLDLIKEEKDKDVSNELDKLSLESILAEASEHEYNDDEIYNDKMKELYDEFLDKVEEARTNGNDTEDSIKIALESLETKIGELVNESIDLSTLEDIRRDIRLIQNVIESYLSGEYEDDIVEEGYEKKGKDSDDEAKYKNKKSKSCTKESIYGIEFTEIDDVEEIEEAKCGDKKKVKKSGCKEESDEEIGGSVKTIDTTFENDIQYEIENEDGESVKENTINVLETYIDKIDEKIDVHNHAKDFADDAVYVTEDYDRFVIPIMNKADSNLEGLKLPYKMKAVLESLLNTMENFNSCDTLKAVKKAINTNKENVYEILEAYKTIPSTPVYKVNYFNTFNELLDIVNNEADTLLESFDYIEIADGEIDGGIEIIDEDNTFRLVTESFGDEFNPDEVETIDMDYVLADTIAKYTLMETMYTINLESYSYDDIKQLTTKMLNKK